MSKTFKQLVNEAKNVRLAESRKAELRGDLSQFIKIHPGGVRFFDFLRHHVWSTTNNKFKVSFLKPMPILLAIALLLSGGASFAAQKALPGEALYPIKVGINENVMSWLTLSNEAKANFDAELATRRLEEAEKLAARSRLTADVRTQIETNFKEHSDSVQARIQKFNDPERGAELSARFETSLKAHQKILLDIGNSKGGDTENEIKPLSIQVKSETDDISGERDSQEEKVVSQNAPDVKAAAEGKLNAAENKIAEVKKFIDKQSDRLGSSATIQANARIKVADDLVIQGKAKLDAGAYGEAFSLFQKAQDAVQSAKLLVEAKEELEGDDEDDGGRVILPNIPTPTPTISPTGTPGATPTASPSASPTVRPGRNHESDDNGSESENEFHGEGKVKIDLEL